MKRLRYLRLKKGWKGFDLAVAARVHPSQLSALELGRSSLSPQSPTLWRLAEVLGWQGEPAALLEEMPAGEGEP